MTNFFHKLLNPHCEQCKEEQEDKKFNIAIDVLQSEIASLRHEKQILLQALLPKEEPIYKESNSVPQIINKSKSWRVRQQMLEEADREKARAIQRSKEDAKLAAKSTEELESELLGNDASAEIEYANSVARRITNNA
jgi:hypothetical protein